MLTVKAPFYRASQYTQQEFRFIRRFTVMEPHYWTTIYGLLYYSTVKALFRQASQSPYGASSLWLSSDRTNVIVTITSYQILHGF